MNHDPLTRERDNFKLRFRLFTVAWAMGAILCMGLGFLFGGNLAMPRFVAAATFLLMIPFTLIKKKPIRLLALFALSLMTAIIGISVGMMGILLTYDPFIWNIIVEIFLLGLLILFYGSQSMKEAFNVKPRELRRKSVRILIVMIPLMIIIIWILSVRILPSLIPNMPDKTCIYTKPIILQARDNPPDGYIMRSVLVHWIPIPENSYLKGIWQGKTPADHRRYIHIAALTDDGIVVGIGQRIQTALLISGRVMLKQMGVVGPYDSLYKWANWIATDRTSFLSEYSRGFVDIFTFGRDNSRVSLLKTPDFVGAVERKSGEYNVVVVDLVSRGLGTGLSLRYSSDQLTTDQLWNRLKPVIASTKLILNEAKLKSMISNLQKADEEGRPPNFQEDVPRTKGMKFRTLDESMEEARKALSEKRYEDAKWALVYPIFMNYKGGEPYVLFGKALLAQGHPRDAHYILWKAEHWLKDDPELKTLQEETERELDKLDPTGERHKPNPEVEKLIQEGKKLGILKDGGIEE